MTKYLRNKNDGFIYPWTPILAKNALCEEVTEAEAFPERFIPPKVKTRKRKSSVALETADIPEKTSYTSPEIAEEASRGLPQ